MKYLGGILLVLLVSLNGIQGAFSFISKGTVESVMPSGKVLRPVLRSAKISRLFSLKPKIHSPVWKAQNETPMVVSTEEPQSQALVQDNEIPSSENSMAKVIYNPSSNPLISPESWKNLNAALSEEDMKRFLTTLPLHTLRTLTSVSKRNPELGQKQLMRLILDRSHRLKIKAPDIPPRIVADKVSLSNATVTSSKKNESPLPSDIQEIGSIPSYLNMDNLSKKLDEMGNLPNHMLVNEVDNSLAGHTSTTPLPVIDPPHNILRRPTTSTPISSTEQPQGEAESERKHRVLPLPPSVPAENSAANDVKVIMMGSPDAQGDSPRQLNSFNINSGYYIPPLTSTEGTPENPGASSSDHMEVKDSQYHPQDPENTYHPNLDKFMRPPHLPAEDPETFQSHPTEQVHDRPSSSSVWVPSKSFHNKHENGPSLKEVQKRPHPFSGFNSINKLQPAESQDHGSEYYPQSTDPQNPQYSSRPQEEDDMAYANRVRKPSEDNPGYNYAHSTVHTESPQHTYKVVSSEPQDQYDQKFHSVYHNSPQGVKNEDTKSPAQHHQYVHLSKPVQSYNSEGRNPSSSPTFSDTFHHRPDSPESSPAPEWQYFGDGYDHESGMWDQVKSYFHKGKKSTAEKVFEISIAILSFLAFGGYILMLIYQVLAVSATFPLFPILSTTVPQNPTLIGLLLGRGMNSEPVFNLAFPGQKVAEKYINELEVVVKRAMTKVKESLEGVGDEKSRLKGDLGH